MKPRSISAFFPALNEEDNIRRVIESALSVLRRITDEYEVIVVLYEGSRDRTEEIVRDISSRNPKVRLVMQPLSERGYGVALKMGYQNARSDLIFYSDADRQFDLEQLGKHFGLNKRFDLVVGYRRKRRDPWMRIAVSKIYNWILRLVFALEQKDVNCAFKLCRKSIFDKITLNCKTGLANTELLVKARLSDFSIVEVGVDHLPRIAGSSYFEASGGKLMNLPRPGVVWEILREMRTLRREIADLKARKV